jgi:uroporphyrinogen III methyltransferase/synthase
LVGKVYLIGAGPGDPGLITVKGLRRLQEAQVVVYDRLVDRRVLHKADKEAELVFVGKGPGERVMEQEEINRYLVDKVLEGRVVARLKGGDPFVFGRGGEEAQALALAGVPFEVVPGVSSAIAAPAYAGIPLTHRGMASSFTVVSGSEDPSKADSAVCWDVLARGGGTLVVLMGWAALDNITGTLISEGMAPSTPAALIRWGTEPCQRTVTGTLENIVPRGREAGLTSPVVAVIGQVVDLRHQVRWFDTRPLFGKRVLVTRSRVQASALSEMLAEEGAEPVEVAAIEFSPVDDYSRLDDAIRSLHSYDWVVFTSVNGVEAFFDRLRSMKRDSRAFGRAKVGAIGPATAAALSQHGIEADFMPPQYMSESLVQHMDRLEIKGARVLLPRADIARDELGEGLARLGAQVEPLTVYRTIMPDESREKALGLLKGGDVDLVTFTSSSTVLNLLKLLDGDGSLFGEVQVACIGPITARTAREAGLRVDIVAQEHTIPGLVRALKEHF